MTGVGSTGGLGWHLRAWRYRRSLWANYLAQTASFLEDWSSQSLKSAQVSELIIVGASAGWSLPVNWVRGFSSLVLIDPDPLAPWLFKRNHPVPAGQTRTWIRRDFQAALPDLLNAQPRAAILFNNLLGQLRLMSKDLDATEQALAQIQSLLAGRHWASFHDRLSGDWTHAQQSAATIRVAGTAGTVSNDELAKSYGRGGEWLDHLTSQVLPPDTPRVIYPWRITPDRLHVVEAGWVAPNWVEPGPLEPDQG
jgi:hypothetical protein